MNSKLTRVICILILMVMVLLAGATPIAAHSMDMEGTEACPSSSPAQTSAPSCCVIQDCPLTNAATAILPLSTGQLTQSKDIQAVQLNANLVPQSSCDQNQSCQQSTYQSIPRPPGADYPCRNSLQSEEPPLN